MSYLGAIRTRAAGYLTDSCTIEREQVVIDDLGGTVSTWAVSASAVPCRVVKAGRRYAAEDQLIAEQETLEEVYRLAVGASVTLDVNYRVRLGEVIYQVVGIETSLTDKVFRHALIARRPGADGT